MGLHTVTSVTLLCPMKAHLPWKCVAAPSPFPAHTGNGRNVTVTSMVTFEVTVTSWTAAQCRMGSQQPQRIALSLWLMYMHTAEHRYHLPQGALDASVNLPAGFQPCRERVHAYMQRSQSCPRVVTPTTLPWTEPPLTNRAGAGSICTVEVSPQHGPWKENNHM